jgi:hypothetical protein
VDASGALLNVNDLLDVEILVADAERANVDQLGFNVDDEDARLRCMKSRLRLSCGGSAELPSRSLRRSRHTLMD